ncbi:MAG: DUF4293 domain-containing protein [Bacteroidales bacterium]|nr:DUF4293 domain-containing protein [Bacteroidales bacterium]
MIQRKQSLFLLMSAIIMALIACFPIANYYADSLDGYSYILKLFSFKDMSGTLGSIFSGIFNLPLILIWAFSIILSLVTIFIYKRRSLQLKLISVNIALVMSFMLLIFIYYTPKIEKELFVTTEYSSCFGIYIPVLVFLLLVLAFSGVKKDIRIVQSYDRLR